jgi:hypothetical protein
MPPATATNARSSPIAAAAAPPIDRRAFLRHVAKTGDPHSFPGVVTSEPPPDAEFVWLTGVIKVPVAKREDGLMIPCPWCSRGRPKFKKGRLCWFHAEGVARFIGWECAKVHLDADLMRAADQSWREENRKRRRDAFLRANCRRALEFLELANTLPALADACDSFHRDFAKDRSGIHADLARYVRKGELTVYETPGGQVLRHHERSFSRLFGVLNGTAVFKSHPHFKGKLRVVIIRLRDIAQDASPSFSRV